MLGDLIREGFFESSKKRSMEDVAKALEKSGLSIQGKEKNIESFLARRVKKGVLKRIESDGTIYWAE